MEPGFVRNNFELDGLNLKSSTTIADPGPVRAHIWNLEFAVLRLSNHDGFFFAHKNSLFAHNGSEPTRSHAQAQARAAHRDSDSSSPPRLLSHSGGPDSAREAQCQRPVTVASLRVRTRPGVTSRTQSRSTTATSGLGTHPGRRRGGPGRGPRPGRGRLRFVTVTDSE